MALAKRSEPERFTYGDYLGWSDDERWELIDGFAYAMSPAPTYDHQCIVGGIHSQLEVALRGHPWRPIVAPFDVRLPRGHESDEATETVLQPDILVVCDPDKLKGRGMRGAPDLVVEVLSPSTAAYDQIRKRAAYERAGVRELWFVHPVDRTIGVYKHDGEQFRTPRYADFEEPLAVGVLADVGEEGIAIDWAPIVERLGPQAV